MTFLIARTMWPISSKKFVLHFPYLQYPCALPNFKSSRSYGSRDILHLLTHRYTLDPMGQTNVFGVLRLEFIQKCANMAWSHFTRLHNNCFPYLPIFIILSPRIRKVNIWGKTIKSQEPY
uniref:Uncharacterized protein n=2 Tax=Cacopsylla melanoneura TaxID=428564 RepID=A0A8D8ZBK6_9HEMI